MFPEGREADDSQLGHGDEYGGYVPTILGKEGMWVGGVRGAQGGRDQAMVAVVMAVYARGRETLPEKFITGTPPEQHLSSVCHACGRSQVTSSVSSR